METNPVLSIGVLTYNHERYIRQCLDSILVQEIDVPYEIVIADDCSTDGNREIIEEYRTKRPDVIRTVYQAGNVGMYENFYHLLNALEGDFIALVEGDDYWTDPGKLKMQLDVLMQRPEYVCCFHPAKVLKEADSNNKLTFSRYPAEPVPQTTTIKYMLQHGNYVPTASTLFRNIFRGQFPRQVANPRLIPDSMLHLIMISRGPYYCIERMMSVYRINVGGVTETRTNLDEKLTAINIYDVSDEFSEGKWHAEHMAAKQKYYYYILDYYRKENNRKEVKRYLELIVANREYDPQFHINFVRKVWLETFVPGAKFVFRLLGK